MDVGDGLNGWANAGFGGGAEAQAGLGIQACFGVDRSICAETEPRRGGNRAAQREQDTGSRRVAQAGLLAGLRTAGWEMIRNDRRHRGQCAAME